MVALSTPISRRLQSVGDLLVSDAPLGFAGGDANLTRYVGNHPTIATDPDGLEERKGPPSPANLAWSDFPEVETPPKGGEGAFTSVKPVTNDTGSLKATPTNGKLVGTWTFGNFTFKYVFNKDGSYQVIGMTSDALLDHEKLHLETFEYMAKKFEQYMKAQMLKGTWESQEAAKKAKADYLEQQKELLKKFAQQVSDIYDKQTKDGTDPDGQADWKKNWQSKIDAYWQKYYPNPPPLK